MVLLYMVAWIPSIYPLYVSRKKKHTWILWVMESLNITGDDLSKSMSQCLVCLSFVHIFPTSFFHQFGFVCSLGCLTACRQEDEDQTAFRRSQAAWPVVACCGSLGIPETSDLAVIFWKCTEKRMGSCLVILSKCDQKTVTADKSWYTFWWFNIAMV